MRYRVFISSVQREFAEERRMLADYLQKDALFARFFDTFVFENLPAKDWQPEKAYIEEVKNCDIFLILLGKEYGYEFPDGTSPTQREYATATENNKYRLAFLLDIPANERHTKTQLLVKQIADSVVYKIFSSSSELLSNVYTSLINFLTEKGELRVEPFDKSPNRDAELSDISEEKIEWFVRRAKTERNFPLSVEDGKEKILTHLNLLNRGKITNAAILLFGKQPQRFFLTSEVKCAHFHGTRVQKPIPFYQVYKGNLFELADQAVDFVLSKIDLAIGTRKHSIEVPTAYEIPADVIKEAIVNAIAHRDYDSTASVQVMLFRDRIEVWNPGNLPPQLMIETLKDSHGSYPHNPLIADALYYAHYIERMGTGIQDIVEKCLNYGLPEPQFVIRDGFVAIIYRKQGIAYRKVSEESGEIKEKISKSSEENITDVTENVTDVTENVGDAAENVTDVTENVTDATKNVTDVTENVTDSINNVTDNFTDVIENVDDSINNVTDDVTDNRISLIIDILKSDNKISTTDIAKQLNVSKRTILRDIEKMKEAGLLERIGTEKGGYWKIITYKK